MAVFSPKKTYRACGTCPHATGKFIDDIDLNRKNSLIEFFKGTAIEKQHGGMSKTETYIQAQLFFKLKNLGFDVRAEYPTPNNGWIDLYARSSDGLNRIYEIKAKLDTGTFGTAVAQILNYAADLNNNSGKIIVFPERDKRRLLPWMKDAIDKLNIECEFFRDSE